MSDEIGLPKFAYCNRGRPLVPVIRNPTADWRRAAGNAEPQFRMTSGRLFPFREILLSLLYILQSMDVNFQRVLLVR